jgi:hypothetical protein
MQGAGGDLAHGVVGVVQEVGEQGGLPVVAGGGAGLRAGEGVGREGALAGVAADGPEDSRRGGAVLVGQLGGGC